MRDENAHDTKRRDPPAQTRYSDEEIAAAVRQAQVGVPVAEIVRKLGVSEATFYVWVKRFERFQTPESGELRQLRDENAQLKRLVADLKLNRQVCKVCSEKAGGARTKSNGAAEHRSPLVWVTLPKEAT